MKFREFETKIKKLPVFKLNDIRKIDPGFHRQQLTYWQKAGYIKSLPGSYYILAERQVKEDFLYMFANRLYEPSYISLESALAYYQIIPETVFGVTSVSSRKTARFQSDYGILSYKSIQPAYFFGYQINEPMKSLKYKIANIEKAVLDFLYFHPEIKLIEDLQALRWNSDLLRIEVNKLRFSQYLQIFNKKSLNLRVNTFMEYINA